MEIFFQEKALLLPDSILRERQHGGNCLENKGLSLLLFSKVLFTSAPMRSGKVLKILECTWLDVWKYSTQFVHIHCTIKNNRASWDWSRVTSGALYIFTLRSKYKEIFMFGAVSQSSQTGVLSTISKFPIWWISKIKNWSGKHLKTTLPWIKYFWSWIKAKQKAWLTCQIISALNFKVWFVLFTWKRSQETNLAPSIFITFFRLYGWLNQSRVPILIFFERCSHLWIEELFWCHLCASDVLFFFF